MLLTSKYTEQFGKLLIDMGQGEIRELDIPCVTLDATVELHNGGTRNIAM